jgi:hypothetical protein
MSNEKNKFQKDERKGLLPLHTINSEKIRIITLTNLKNLVIFFSFACNKQRIVWSFYNVKEHTLSLFNQYLFLCL